MLLSQATKIYLGTAEALKVYLGSALVWTKPTGGGGSFSFSETFDTSAVLTNWVIRAFSDNYATNNIQSDRATVTSGRLRLTSNTNARYPQAARAITGLVPGETYNISIDLVTKAVNIPQVSVRSDLYTFGEGAPGRVYYSGDILATGTITGSFVATQTTHYFHIDSGAEGFGHNSEWDNLLITGGPTGTPAPAVITPIADQSAYVGSAPIVVNLAPRFSNADTYSVSPTGQGVSILDATMTTMTNVERNASYTVTATGAGGTVTDTFTVVITTEPEPPTGDFTFTPATINENAATGTTVGTFA